MSFMENVMTPHAFWVKDRGGIKGMTPAEAAGLPVDGRMELSLLPIRNCRDVLVVCGENRSTVFWDARRALRSTIERALDCIDQNGTPQRLRFHTLIDAWLTTDFDSRRQATEQLDWFDRHKEVLLLPGTSVFEKTIEDMLEESTFLSSAFSAWRGAAAGGDPDQLFSIIDDALLYEMMGTGGPMELVYPGKRHPISLIYGDEWRRRTVSMAQLQNMTDENYEQRVTGVYDEVISCRQPRYDHIHAYVKVKIGLPRWARYRRLLLPWPTTGTAKAIYCLAEPTNQIDIPFAEVA